jgi:hypothetical protein
MPKPIRPAGLEALKRESEIHDQLVVFGTNLGPWDFKTIIKYFKPFKVT